MFKVGQRVYNKTRRHPEDVWDLPIGWYVVKSINHHSTSYAWSKFAYLSLVDDPATLKEKEWGPFRDFTCYFSESRFTKSNLRKEAWNKPLE